MTWSQVRHSIIYLPLHQFFRLLMEGSDAYRDENSNGDRNQCTAIAMCILSIRLKNSTEFQLNIGSCRVVSENFWSRTLKIQWLFEGLGSGKHFGCLDAGLLSTKYGHLPPGKIIIWPFRYAIMDQNYAAAPSTSPTTPSSSSTSSLLLTISSEKLQLVPPHHDKQKDYP